MDAEQQLRANLIAVHSLDATDPFDKEVARKAILSSDLEMIVCARPDGWPQGVCAMFGRLFQWTYHETLAGKAWKPKKVAAK